MNVAELGQQIADLGKGNLIRRVAFGFGGIGMRFEENAIATGGDCGARQHRYHSPVTTGVTTSTGHLHTVRGVEDHRVTEFTHNRQRSHVDDEVAVAECRAAFGEHDVVIAGGFHFRDGVLGISRREELAFLDVDATFGARGSLNQIGLPTEKCRDLQHIANFSNGPALRNIVNVGEHRNAEGAFDFGERGKTTFQTGTAKAVAGGAVGFVETGFENKRQTEVSANADEHFGGAERQDFVFDDARPGDDEQRCAGAAEFQFAHANGFHAGKSVAESMVDTSLAAIVSRRRTSWV